MPQITIDAPVQHRLEQGARLLGVPLPATECERLLRFLSLLLKWNKAYNLTALQTPMEMVERHLLDSLSILPYVPEGRILDMGTGPGLPGIPLALLRPHSHFVLLDSNGKKIRFVRQVVLELGLVNVQPEQARVEQYRPLEPFDTIVARAFTALPRMLELTHGLLRENGCLLAMKGTLPAAELQGLPATHQVRVHPLQVPFCEAARHLIEIRRRH